MVLTKERIMKLTTRFEKEKKQIIKSIKKLFKKKFRCFKELEPL